MEIELDGSTFWVLIQKGKLTLFSERGEGIKKLGKALPTQKDSTLAELTYDAKKESFGVEPVSWKDISLTLLGMGEEEK